MYSEKKKRVNFNNAAKHQEKEVMGFRSTDNADKSIFSVTLGSLHCFEAV